MTAIIRRLAMGLYTHSHHHINAVFDLNARVHVPLNNGFYGYFHHSVGVTDITYDFLSSLSV